MWRNLRVVTAFVPRTRLGRAWFAVFAFCLVNAAWAVVGTWTVRLGGESMSGLHSGSRESGMYSCRGYLVVAQRSAYFWARGVYTAEEARRPAVRQTIPWSVSANLYIGPGTFRGYPGYAGNGILDDRPRTIAPGVVVNWKDPRGPGDEWYNRGVAVHWLWLTLAAAAPPLLAWARGGRRSTQGRCNVCGYDLRATPQCCPECGTVPANGVSV
jgi:hypothetical protein